MYIIYDLKFVSKDKVGAYQYADNASINHIVSHNANKNQQTLICSKLLLGKSNKESIVIINGGQNPNLPPNK